MPLPRDMHVELIKFGDFFQDESRYTVPKFQRDYNWTEDHVKEFWKDLLEHWKTCKRQKIRTPYYFGSVMLVTENDPLYWIVDGQQRMVTSMMLFIALRDFFLEHDKDDDVKVLNSIIYYEDKNNKPKLRLELNRYNNSYFETKISKEKKITDKIKMMGKKVYAKNRELSNCYTSFAKKITDDDDKNFRTKIEDKLDDLRDLYEHLQKRFVVVENIFSNKLNAYRIFETINHKGLRLDENDLVKNYLMESIDAGSTNELELIDADDKWEEIVSELECIKMKEDVFLRIHLTAFVGKTPRDNIYDNIREKIKDKQSAQKFLVHLLSSVEFLSKIKHAKEEDWQLDCEIVDNLNGLNALTDGGMYPILLVAKKSMTSKELKKLIELVTKLHFRAKTVCGVSYTEVEALVVHICEKLNGASTDYSISDIRDAMTSWSKYPSDDEFEIKFKDLALTSAAKARYVLREIAYAIQGGKEFCPIKLKNNIEIEHIMPKSINNDWIRYLKNKCGLATPTDIDEYRKRNLHKLGNLTLLTPAANKISSNALFLDKLNGIGTYPGYRNDALKITSCLKKHKSWVENNIQKRQVMFFSHAKKIWDLKSIDISS